MSGDLVARSVGCRNNLIAHSSKDSCHDRIPLRACITRTYYTDIRVAARPAGQRCANRYRDLIAMFIVLDDLFPVELHRVASFRVSPVILMASGSGGRIPREQSTWTTIFSHSSIREYYVSTYRPYPSGVTLFMLDVDR